MPDKQRSLPLTNHVSLCSPLAFGCMGLGGGWNQDPLTDADVRLAHQVVDAALENGITFFDHADIYTFGKAEQVFGRVLTERPELRQQLALQSKCGIRFAGEGVPGRYDFSAQWIEHSVDGILQRLQMEQIDVLLLHRPDPLMEPEEVAATLQAIHAKGKVRHVGVSNMSLHQIELLQASLDLPLVVNQLELSLAKLDWLDEGVMVGHPEGRTLSFGPGTLEYCRRQGIQVQSWGSLAQGIFSGRDVSGESGPVRHTAQLVQELAHGYQVSPEAIVLGWLMRHPAQIQPVIGTTNADRIRACAQAADINLSRDDWYRLYVAARGADLP